MELLRNFKKLNKNDVSLAGGKGASLGEMMGVGIPVPPGFVILSTAFEKFLEETDLNVEIDSILDSVNHREIHTIEYASEKTQALILQAEMPKDIAEEIQKSFKKLNARYVAVRSSATAEDSASAAWAGQLESYLNTTEENLLENVKKCWASLFTPRAIFYRFEKDLHKQKISVAVVVQKMIESEKSGIVFSVHPVTQDRNQLIIEAGFGLGEAIVSGSITPDSYVVEKEPRRIIDTNISNQTRGLYRSENGGNEWRELGVKGEKKVLDEKQILELSEIILKIENHYGFPCDIEWAFENGKFYIVQSRPITTLSLKTSKNYTGGINSNDYHFFGLWKSTLFPIWYWAKWLLPEYADKIGLNLSDGGVFVINGGNFFTKKSVIENIRQYAKSIVESNDKNRLATFKKLANDVYADSLKTAESLSVDNSITESNIREMAELGQRIMFPWCFGYIFSQPFDEFLILAAENIGIRREDISSLLPSFRTPLMDAQDNLRSIKKVLEEKGIWKILLEDSSKAIKQIRKDAEISKLIKEYSSKYGWIAIISLMGDDPSFEQVIDQITHIPVLNHKEHVSKTEKELSFLVDCVITAAYLKQTGVEYFSMYSRHAMKLLKATAKKLGIAYRELLDLNLNEIIAGINGADVKKIIKHRAGDKWAIYSMPDNQEPIVIDDPEILEHLASVMIPKAEASDGGSINGQVGNKGIGKGKVILSLEDFHKMEKGDVLVTTMTTPDFVPLMQKSVAIITDIGGLLCHAAIISRELNIPCVIGTKFATQLLKDGNMVEVNANQGVIRIIK